MSGESIQTVQLQGWLQRMRAGDAAAHNELLQTFCTRLENLARKMLRGFPQVKRWTETDDVLQSALIRLMRSLQKVEPGSVREFLGLAALEIRRELLDLARHFAGPRRMTSPLGADEGSRAGVAEPAAPQEDSDELERWQSFHEGVEGLPVEEREVVNLIYYHGWSQAEVAALFEISDRTVRRRWESAMVKLHQHLHGPKANE